MGTRPQRVTSRHREACPQELSGLHPPKLFVCAPVEARGARQEDTRAAASARPVSSPWGVDADQCDPSGSEGCATRVGSPSVGEARRAHRSEAAPTRLSGGGKICTDEVLVWCGGQGRRAGPLLPLGSYPAAPPLSSAALAFSPSSSGAASEAKNSIAKASAAPAPPIAPLPQEVRLVTARCAIATVDIDTTQALARLQ